MLTGLVELHLPLRGSAESRPDTVWLSLQSFQRSGLSEFVSAEQWVADEVLFCRVMRKYAYTGESGPGKSFFDKYPD